MDLFVPLPNVDNLFLLFIIIIFLNWPVEDEPRLPMLSGPMLILILRLAESLCSCPVGLWAPAVPVNFHPPIQVF